MHRDLKLENIMVHFPNLPKTQSESNKYVKKFDFKTMKEEIVCKIADLGFANKLANEEITNTLCGTPLCMAPEVILGHPYT